MIKNLRTGHDYVITGVKEQNDGSYFVSMDLNDPENPTTSMGVVKGKNGLQEISDLAWPREELERQAMEFLHG